MPETTTGTLACADCSAPLFRQPGGGRPPQVCKPCLAQRRRKSQKDQYDAKHGKPKTGLVCTDCSASFQRPSMNGVPAKRCPDCVRKRENALACKQNRQKREGRPAAPARTSTCERCGHVFDLARKGPAAKVCPACHTARATEYIREWRRARQGPAPILHCCDCGVQIMRRPGRGATPKRCRPCAYKKDLERVRDWRTRQPKASLDCVCMDCQRDFVRSSRLGFPPLRCPECTAARRRATLRDRQRAVSLRRYLSEGRWSSCDRCGGEVALARKGPKSRHCQPCWRTVRIEAYWDGQGKTPNAIIPCADCGAGIMLHRKGTSRKRCSTCAAARREQQSTAWWRNATPEYRAAKWRQQRHRRRAAKRGAGSERFSDREIFVRDRWTCQICGKKVDPFAKWPNQRCASLDHTVPLSQGGAHTRANTRLAHWICNSLRGDRGGNEQLALIG